MYYKLSVVIFVVALGLYFATLTGPINKSEKIWEFILYILLGCNIAYCYKFEQNLDNPLWPRGIFIEMFTKRPVLMFAKGGTFLFILIFAGRDALRVFG